MKPTFVFGAGLLSVLAVPGYAQTAAELAYCNQLAAYYDRYNVRYEGASSSGGPDRILGYERCRKGEVAAGTAQLQRAIRLIGFDPPKQQ